MSFAKSKIISVAETFLGLVNENEIAAQLSGKFPRNMEALVVYGLNIPVEYKPNLTTQAAGNYLCQLHGQPVDAPCIHTNDRPLFGLFHLGPPCNLILLRSGLSFEITNYVLAHEIGHFFADIFFLSNLWLKSLPEQKENIERAFSWQEYDVGLELQAAVKGLPSRPKPIIERGSTAANQTIESEIQADLIARELLAPWSLVAPLYKQYKKPDMVSYLRRVFGLPLRVAWAYYQDLQIDIEPQTDMIGRLFKPFIDNPNSTKT